jgi:alpha-L-arabinofuranosidase
VEGFIIRVRDQGNRFVHVNFGGWGNTQHGIEQNGSNPIVRKAGSIELNRWYDIEIALQDDRVSVKLDGALLFDSVRIPADKAPPVTLVAGLDKQAGEIVVKCVNPTPTACPLQLQLAGAKVPAQSARRITLTGAPEAINDLDNPRRIAPVEDTLPVAGPNIQTTLPPNSLTVLRVKSR